MTGRRWQLDGFMPALRNWMVYDPPPADLLVKAAEFGAELERDPLFSAELEYGNLYFRIIPGTEHDGRIVSITFSLGGSMDRNAEGEVQCKDVACVPHPQRALPVQWPPPRHHPPE